MSSWINVENIFNDNFINLRNKNSFYSDKTLWILKSKEKFLNSIAPLSPISYLNLNCASRMRMANVYHYSDHFLVLSKCTRSKVFYLMRWVVIILQFKVMQVWLQQLTDERISIIQTSTIYNMHKCDMWLSEAFPSASFLL